MNESFSRFYQLLFDKGIAFARYSLPGETKTITIVSFNPISYEGLNQLVDNQDEGFIFAPFEVTKNLPIWFLKSDDIIDESSDIKSLENILEALPDIKLKADYTHESTSKSDYSRAFDMFMQELSSDKLDKVILSKIVIKHRKEEPLIYLFTRLSEKYPTAFTYMIHLPSGEIWMGATPELLLRQDESGIQTMALAGTQVLNNRLIDEVVWENKEIEEQAYVRNYVKKVLDSVSDSVKVSNTYSAKAGNLVHVRTDFIVNQVFNRSEVFEIVKNLHPTPAVCGIPLENSKSLILKTEQHNRAYYTGILGPIKKDSMNLFVNLRCMQVLPKSFAIYVGGGITRDSIIENEWEETEAKAQTLLAIID
ncbi:MAG: chorismate-binding protein [Bacteroidales bacterium]|jgi:isochorismate synthase|nr:chorismate-binding protein [Bacteroidales bacterium]